MTQRSRREPRIFTVEEANALLPRLREILAEMAAGRERLLQAQEALAKRMHGGGARTNGHVAPGGEIDRLNKESAQAQADIGRGVTEIAEMGCELKDPDRGMVDFRAMREGRVVYLCWLAHEPQIMYWHELSGGYNGRQVL